MGTRLVGEVVNWLLSPAASELTPNERFVLVLIAERANDKTRDMWRHKIDEETLAERIARGIGIPQKALGAVLGRLAARGLEVRVPIGVDKLGRTVFAMRGKATAFRLPELPASVALPTGEWSRQGGTIQGSQEPPESPENAPADTEWSLSGRTKEANGPDSEGPKPPNGPSQEGPYPYKELPSKEDPSTPSVPQSQPEVEGSGRDRSIFIEDQKFDHSEYVWAQKRLLSRPDAIALIDQAAAERPRACREIHVIRAAQLAKGGIPA